MKRRLSGWSLVLRAHIKPPEIRASVLVPLLKHAEEGLGVRAVGWSGPVRHGMSPQQQLHLLGLQWASPSNTTREPRKRVSLFSFVWLWKQLALGATAFFLHPMQ